MDELDDPIRKWMSDWADMFDQSWDDEKLQAFVGKTVDLQRPELDEDRPAKTFTFTVVGWSRDRLQDIDGSTVVNKWSLLTNDGNQIALYAGSTVTIAEGTEE